MTNNAYLLGVDIGTYSSKGVLVTPDGEVVASHVVDHEMSMPHAGWFEHDADAVWWHDFVAIVRALLTKSSIAPAQILGIGTSAIGSCVLPIDDQGHPLRPGILYGIDTRATAEIEALNRAIGENEIVRTGGSGADYASLRPEGPLDPQPRAGCLRPHAILPHEPGLPRLSADGEGHH